jgi:excisionase family DNA binding protein
VNTAELSRLAQLESALNRMAEELRLSRVPRPPQCLTVAQVCETLGMAKRTVYHFIQTGELRAAAFDAGKRVFYRVQPNDLQSFIDSRKGLKSQTQAAEPDIIRIPVYPQRKTK